MRVKSDQTDRIAVRVSPALKAKFEKKAAKKKQSISDRLRAFMEQDASRPNTEWIDVVFDGPPGPKPGRFVEVNNAEGASVCVGEWVQYQSGMWALRITLPLFAGGVS